LRGAHARAIVSGVISARRGGFSSISLVIGLAAMVCAADGARADEPSALWRGNFALGRHGAEMSPCFSGSRIEVDDATPGGLLSALYRELASRPGKPIFVEFSGTRTAGRVRAEALHRASRDGPGCRENVSALRLVALGSDPLWRLESGADGVRLYRAGAGSRDFPPRALASRGAEFVYEGANASSVLRLTVTPGGCRDRLSNAFFDHSAEVRLDGETLRGCTYRGDLERPLSRRR
jgi:uncharacterized membrane protein